MRGVLLTIVFGALLAPANAQFVIPPYVSDVLDAASYTPGIAPGGLFVVKGYQLCPNGLKISSLPLQTEFNGVGVALTPAGGGQPVKSFVLYTYQAYGADDQIAAVLPSSAAPGTYDITVTTGSTTVSRAGWARVVSSKYRSLTNNQQGYGLAVVQNYVDPSRLDRNMFVAGTIGALTKAPANPGQTVILWGLGLGAISRADNEPPGAIDLRSERQVRVAVGGVGAPVAYAGRSPEFPGLDQINITLPANVPAGCNVPVEVIVDGSPSNPVTMAIAPAGKSACEHPFLSADQLDKLDRGGKMMAGEFNLMVYREQADSYAGQPFVEIHNATGYFGAMTASRASTVDLDSVPLSRCVSWRMTGESQGYLLDAYAADSYDGGRLTLSGPGFADAPLDDADDWYSGEFSVRRVSDGALLAGDGRYRYVPGEYALKGAGGADIDAFEVKLQMPEFLAWTNMDEIGSIDRNAPPEIRWTGCGTNDRVIIEGFSAVMVGGTVSNPEVEIGTFICAVPPSSKSFTPPADVLKLLPVGESSRSIGALIVSGFAHGSRSNFKAAVKKRAADQGFGTELGIATFGHLVMTTKLLNYR